MTWKEKIIAEMQWGPVLGLSGAIVKDSWDNLEGCELSDTKLNTTWGGNPNIMFETFCCWTRDFIYYIPFNLNCPDVLKMPRNPT